MFYSKQVDKNASNLASTNNIWHCASSCFETSAVAKPNMITVLLYKIRCAKKFKAFVKWTKIDVQSMWFTLCLNMGPNLTILKMSPDFLSAVTHRSFAATTDYVDVFVHEHIALVTTLWRRYGVRPFKADVFLYGIKTSLRIMVLCSHNFFGTWQI